MNITKGMRIRARWFRPNPASLAGMQMKVSCTQVEVSGIVRHIRIDDPDHPTKYTLFIDADAEGLPQVNLLGCTCGHGHIQVDPKHVFWAGSDQGS